MNPIPDPSSFTARRSAASNLPSFQLPPVQRYSSMAPGSYPSGAHFNTGHLLTPPSTIPGESMSSIISTQSTAAASMAGHAAFTPYTPLSVPSSQSYEWGVRHGPSPTFASAPPPLPPPPPPPPPNPGYAMRPGFVPSTQTSRHLASLQANAAHNAQGGDVVPLHPPPFDTNTPAYTMSTPMSLPPTGTSATTGLPTLPAQHSYMGNTMLSQQFPSSRTPSHLSPAHHAQGLVTPRMPRTQACYPGVHPASAPAHQTSFSSSSTGASPPHQSPGSTGSAPRLSPGSPTAHRMSLLHPTPGPTPAVAHLPRSLSISHLAMPSPMAPGLQGPGTPIGYAGAPSPGLAHIYGNHGTFVRTYPGGPRPTPPQRQNERPFKCNQCPQSFNRNHDLKRHKRIHLAVKPFPCRHCDKSFSRKDALKRHILVKGCGKAQPVNATDGHDDASSTHEQSEIMSGEEDAGESPGIGSHLAYQPGPS